MTLRNDIVLTNITLYRSQSEDAVPVLKHMHLRIAEGEWISVVGPNGSGKSSFAQFIAGVIDRASGEFHRGFLPEIIPYVMQQNVFFGETPWEDIVFQLEMRSEEPLAIPAIAEQALAAVGLGTLMHQPLAQLSGGQKQLAAIAGCIAAKAPLLLFDEATSMLDSSSRKLVLEAALALHHQGTSVIWLTHHMEELVVGGRVVGLEQGNVIFDGTPASFFYGDYLQGGGVLGSGSFGGSSLHDDSQDDTLGGGSLHDVSQNCTLGDGSLDGDPQASLSPCELLGFSPPYPVQVARELIRQGVPLPSLPLTSAQLAEAVAGDG
ncbi:energy-coupling factor ABC transporter ATP-binding protein [Paenibacillus agricola]|uniref:ATP-binding cassette domain-containing protein n=1 Tax=Paenibacillus agricola TaxID=2716264 RepID=A0ABX0JA25_9BACL|nr:ATP-binding cassette domain-containing protein [Paenibacillus agricola]NHN31029.1 ATP-binding cassette domain-containing protein [Paenibacillus agricola]